MKYWVYINNKVVGPFTADKLVTLNGFTPETLICSEDAANSGNQEWVQASNVFEFEQPAPVQPAPVQVVSAQPQPVVQTPEVAPVVQQQGTQATVANEALTTALLAKLDALTSQLVSVQGKLDGLQGKMDGIQGKMEGLQSKMEGIQETVDRTETITQQVSQMSQVFHSDPVEYEVTDENETPAKEPEKVEQPENTIPPADGKDLVEESEETVQTDATTQPTAEQTPAKNDSKDTSAENVDNVIDEIEDVFPITDLDQPSEKEDSLLDKDNDDVVLNAALATLRNSTPNDQRNAEDTFQDLLTPVQAASLAKQSQENQQESKQEDTNKAQKDDLINEITSSAPSTSVVDQLIQEKEEDEVKKSMTMRILSAGAAVLGLGAKKKAEETPATQSEPEKKEETATDKPAEEVTSSDTTPAPEQLGELELSPSSSPSQVPSLPEDVPAQKSLDLDALDTEQPATSEPSSVPELLQVEDFADEQKPTSAEEENAKAYESLQTSAPEPVIQVSTDDTPAALPSLDAQNASEETATPTQEENTDPEELVPNAPEEKPDNLISEADLNIAFADQKNHEDESVEQLFGLASAGASVASANTKEEQQTQGNGEIPSLDEISNQTSTATDTDNASSDPNAMSEVELSAGSTYLISDFVPPARTDEPAPQKAEVVAEPVQAEKSNDEFEIQEMVPAARKPLPTDAAVTATTAEVVAEEAPKDTVSDITVSQIVLENTIRAKRGANLDIKTVPLVPEPTKSDRLQIDDINDINTQHDIKNASSEPSGKMAKMVGGSLFALLLAAIVYGMLAFMNLIPQQFNLLTKWKSAEVAQQQDAQINEMLGVQEQPTLPEEGIAPAVIEQDPQAAALTEVKNYMLPNGMTLQAFVEAKHPASVELITWDISTAVDPDNYSILVKVPPENPQSFKISYRFNYNAVTKALDPTISDAKNLLDSAQPQMVQ